MAFGDEEETATRVLAVRALDAIKEKLVIHPLDAAAIILHPSLRSMESVMPFGEREVDRCKRIGSELIRVAMTQTQAVSFQKEPLSGPKPVSNVPSSSDFCISNFYDNTEQLYVGGQRACDDELQSYLSMPLSKRDSDLMRSDDEFSVPRFWIRIRSGAKAGRSGARAVWRRCVGGVEAERSWWQIERGRGGCRKGRDRLPSGSAERI
jgi:hypothetical protein